MELPPIPANRYVCSGPEKASLWAEAIMRSFPSSFLNAALSDPEPQAYEIGWIAEGEGMPKIELVFERNTNQRFGENREVYVSGLWNRPNPQLAHRLEHAWVPGVVNEIFVEQERMGERVIGSFAFKIRPSVTAGRIRDALLAFAILQENVGFRCHSPIRFDFKKERDVMELMRKERDATMEILAMEEIESIEDPDLTQVKQVLAKIMRELP